MPVVPGPMDFSAWFEVFLGDRWYTSMGATTGAGSVASSSRAAANAGDVPITMCFGPNSLTRFDVVTAEVMETVDAA